MSRFTDYSSDPEVRDIMERLIEKFPVVFDGFDVDGLHIISTKKKAENKGGPVKLRTVSYPNEAFVGKPYIVEVFAANWEKMGQKQKNLAVFHVMCGIPIGGFDPESKNYGKKVKPDYEMYRMEFAVAGGVPDWMENDAASDPMEVEAEDVAEAFGLEDAIPDDKPAGASPVRIPVTAESIAEA